MVRGRARFQAESTAGGAGYPRDRAIAALVEAAHLAGSTPEDRISRHPLPTVDPSRIRGEEHRHPRASRRWRPAGSWEIPGPTQDVAIARGGGLLTGGSWIHPAFLRIVVEAAP